MNLSFTHNVQTFLAVLDVLLDEAVDAHIAYIKEKNVEKQQIKYLIYQYKSLAFDEYIKAYGKS